VHGLIFFHIQLFIQMTLNIVAKFYLSWYSYYISNMVLCKFSDFLSQQSFFMCKKRKWNDTFDQLSWKKCIITIILHFYFYQELILFFLLHIHVHICRTIGAILVVIVCNQCLSPLALCVISPFMARCTRYNIIW
jgi:hypothetical protein